MRFLKRYVRQGALGDMLYVAADTLLTLVGGTKASGKAPVIQGDGTVAWTDIATQAELDAVSASAGSVATASTLSVPTVFLEVGGGDNEEFATIPASSTEIDTGLRRRRDLIGAGFYRINANVIAAAASATAGVEYSADGFATSAALTALALTAIGRRTTGWLVAPAGLQADLELRPVLAGGGGTDTCKISLLEIEFLPAIVTAFRDHADDYSDDYS